MSSRDNLVGKTLPSQLIVVYEGELAVCANTDKEHNNCIISIFHKDKRNNDSCRQKEL